MKSQTFAALALTLCPAASAVVIRVNHAAPPGGSGATWATARNSLQSALAIAQPGDEIRVAQGVYRPGPPGAPRSTRFDIPAGIKLRGGYLAVDAGQDIRNPATLVTTLSGDVNADDLPGFVNRGDNVWIVVRLADNDTSTETLVEGFHVRAGNSDDLWNVNANGAGGLFGNNVSSTIRDCVFIDNSGVYAGGVFLANAGAFSNPRPRIERCRFLGNRALPQTSVGGGGLGLANSKAEVVSCIFVGNTSGNRAGAIVSSGFPPSCDDRFINCTIVGNHAPGGGGGVYNNGSKVTLINCVLWGNTSDASTGLSVEQQQVWQLGDAQSEVRRSIVQGLDALAGNGNAGANPQLLDVDGPDDLRGTLDDDVRLGAFSPAYNAGDTNELPAGALRDAAGNSRVWAGIVDMGALERDSFPPFCVGDFNGDGTVDAGDLAALLGTFGVVVTPPAGIVTDLDGNNTVNASDLAILLGSWGACP